MAWVVKAWKPDVLAAAKSEIAARTGRATLRDSPLGDLFRATS